MPAESSNTDGIDIDSLLNLENQFYQEGYEEGQIVGAQQQYHEGKQLGVQTGFQRFLVVGQLSELVKQWILSVEVKVQNGATTDSKGKPRQYSKIHKSLLELQRLLDSFYENGLIRTTNSEVDVTNYESILKKVRAKMRSLSSALEDEELYKSIENTCQLVGGSIPATPMLTDEASLW